MSHAFDTCSEEDIRTKVVYTWLADHGINPAEISLEYCFEVKIGRHTWKIGSDRPLPADDDLDRRDSSVVRPRADVLVRRGEKNLMIIEVKSPDEPLDDAARDQGISYARLLPDIAPFVVLTNGRETKLFDSVTREQLGGQTIPSTHPHARPGFCVSLDDLQLRAEASELFLSLCPENLLTFCQKQVSFRMARLRSDDPESGKKYIPQLYVARTSAETRLLTLLADTASRVVAIVGRPQVGKTNFVCHFVEQQIADGHPCLFYPAIGLENGLLEEIHADFGWLHQEASPSVPILVHKLTRILNRAQAGLLLFIDGWNEAHVELARMIDRECERLTCNEIQIVVSFTNTAAQRLLSVASNPSFIAESTGVGLRGAELIELDPVVAAKQKQWHLVCVDCFSDKERDAAYEKYAKYFSVTVPPCHVRTSDPYLLGVAMRHYRTTTLPDLLDEPELLERWLCERINRVCGDAVFDVRAGLAELGRAMLDAEPPVDERTVKIRWGLPVVHSIPPSLFDAAILSATNLPGPGRAIDFYNARDRSFVIAYWAGNWQSAIADSAEAPLEKASTTEAGRDALTWFFQQQQTRTTLLPAEGHPRHFENACLRRLFLKAIGVLLWNDVDCERRHCRSVEETTQRVLDQGDGPNESHSAQEESPRHMLVPEARRDTLRNYAFGLAKTDGDVLVRIEAFVLVAALIDEKEDDDLVALAPDDAALGDFILSILRVHHACPLSTDSPGAVLLRALQRIHGDDYDLGDEHDSAITQLLLRVVQNDRAFPAAV